MAATESFWKQHAELIELIEIVRKIEPMLVPTPLGSNPAAVRPLLTSLLGKLTVHLVMEDQSLYPRLQSHANADLRALAKKFIDEMAHIKPLVVEFGRKWTDAAISADAKTFCEKSRRIFSALAERIKRENTELYALVDRSS